MDDWKLEVAPPMFKGPGLVGWDSAEQLLAALASHRAVRAAAIIRRPDGFVVCEGCFCLLHVGGSLCTICGGYRLNGDPERVIEIASLSGTRPIGVTSPYLPRTAREFDSA